MDALLVIRLCLKKSVMFSVYVLYRDVENRGSWQVAWWGPASIVLGFVEVEALTNMSHKCCGLRRPA